MNYPNHVTFKFKSFSTTWAALHPEPKGVIFFIGGAFFGTFPTIYYRYLLRNLFNQGYTIVAFPFRFSFKHWSVAVSLAQCKTEIRRELIQEAKRLGYNHHIYEEEPNSDNFNYLWLGHSLGCKYIALLELLTDIERTDVRTTLAGCIGQNPAKELANTLSNVSLKEISLLNQPSVLLDPVVSDLDNAVPFESLRALVSRFVRVQPSREQTFCLVNRSNLFALTSLISFKSQLAKETVIALTEFLGLQLPNFQELPIEIHLAALGFRSGNPKITEATLQAIEKVKSRMAERTS